MDGINQFIEVFNRRYDDFGDVDFHTGRYLESDSDEMEAGLQSMKNTFKYCKIPVEEDTSRTNLKCAKAFKLLLLNTELKCEDDLARDPKIGPFLASSRRKMTPYFLMEVVLSLEYEQILAESLLHMPLDLCIEILEIVKNNIFLWDFERGLNLVIAIILNCHKNLITTCKTGAQSRDLEKNLETLMISTQEFIAFLSNIKFLRLSEVKSLQKSERIGTILAKLIALTIKCLSGTDNDSLSPEVAEHYKLTFGNDPIRKCGSNFNTTLSMLNQEFIHILLKKIGEIDEKCYDNWAAIDANGNNMVSLQCSIRKNLYDFVKFLNVYPKFVVHSKHLIQLIQKLKPQPVDIVSELNLDGLRYGSVEIKIESIKSVIHRYSEWDHDTFDLIQRHRSLLDAEDIPYLIDYLALIMRKPCQENHKRRVFVTIRKVLFQQRVLDDWATEPIVPWEEEFYDSQERESNDAQEQESNDAQEQESNNAQEQESNDAQEQESNDAQEQESNDAQEQESNNAQEQESNDAQEQESNDAQEQESNVAQEQESNDAQEQESNVAIEKPPTDFRKIEFNDTYEYVKPDILECLDSAYSDDNFKSFIASTTDIKSPKNLRTTLLFLLNNPRNVLRILIEVVIGIPDYAHLTIPPEDLIFFYPMIKLGGSEMRLLLSTMCTVIIRCDNWDAQKFSDLVNLMLEEFKFTANDFVTHIFADWVEEKPRNLSVFVQMLKFVQNCVTQKCKPGLDILRLADAFAHRFTDFRSDLLLPRSVSTEILNELHRTAEPFFKSFGNGIREEFSMYELEPIDRFKLPFSLLSVNSSYTDSLGLSILSQLRYDCLQGIQRARSRVTGNIPINPDGPTHCRDFKYMKNDFIRYALIKCSETEIVEFAESMSNFELVGYDVHSRWRVVDIILRRFMETAIYFLEFPDLNPPESFACLMRGLARFIGRVVMDEVQKFNTWDKASTYRQNVDRLRKIYRCYGLFKNNLKALTETMRHSTFNPLWESFMATLDDSSFHNEPRGVAVCKIRSALEKFGNDCLGIAHNEVRFNRAPSARALRFKLTHDFIDECSKVLHLRTDDASQYHSLCATFKLLHTQE